MSSEINLLPLAGWQPIETAPRLTDIAVPLTRGLHAFVSPEDAERVLAFKWHASPKSATADGFYAVRGRSVSRVWLHRFVLMALPPFAVDHIDGDGLNCTRQNLRIATQSVNNHNRATINRSGYRGVTFEPARRKWKATISNGGRTLNLGRFDNAEAAARTYDDHARALFGDAARLNFPLPPPPEGK